MAAPTTGEFHHGLLAGLGRAALEEEERPDFLVYLDEFHAFATESLASMLSELRKYHVGMVLAHQYISQLDPAIRDAVFGNAGTLIAFRVSARDAALLAREFEPTFQADDFLRLPNYQVYLRLMVDGEPSAPFSGHTIPSFNQPNRTIR